MLFEVQLDEVLVDAKHEAHSHFELICATMCLADGRCATSYTYTGGYGGHTIFVLLRNDLLPFLVGRGSIVSFAISAVDIALWDLRCKAVGLRLWQMAGGASNRCKAYASGIDVAPNAKIIRSC